MKYKISVFFQEIISVFLNLLFPHILFFIVEVFIMHYVLHIKNENVLLYATTIISVLSFLIIRFCHMLSADSEADIFFAIFNPYYIPFSDYDFCEHDQWFEGTTTDYFGEKCSEGKKVRVFSFLILILVIYGSIIAISTISYFKCDPNKPDKIFLTGFSDKPFFLLISETMVLNLLSRLRYLWRVTCHRCFCVGSFTENDCKYESSTSEIHKTEKNTYEAGTIVEEGLFGTTTDVAKVYINTKERKTAKVDSSSKTHFCSCIYCQNRKKYKSTIIDVGDWK